MTSTPAAVAELVPSPVWRIFAGIAAIPRASLDEERVRDHLRDFAIERGLEVQTDAIGNLLIRVPATTGYEKAPPVVLQGHLDMVCEKRQGSPHDFDSDPISLVVDAAEAGRKIVRAEGTTLGADNGIGVALGLAAATEPDVVHGPLEILLTVDEESGMGGAKNLDPAMITGRRMLNLDSEEDDAIYVGCAGGCDVTLRWSLDSAEVPNGLETIRVGIGGLPGGHSGLDIHRNRRNAVRLLVELLRRAGGEDLRLLSFSGGSRRNAIPRDAAATVAGSPGLLQRLTTTAAAMNIDGRPDHGTLTAAPAEAPETTGASSADTRRVLSTIAALHHGVLAVVPEMAGEILSSNNVATVETDAKGNQLEVAVACLVRSADAADIDRVARQLEAIAELAGATTGRANEYPGWKPDMDSATLATCRRLYEETFGRPARIAAIHAGLECGIINERLGGEMDVVSFGPTIEGAHSPDELVFVDSVDKIWKYLKQVLAELAKA